MYTDNWGSVVLRNEAWILLKGLICEIQKRTPIWVIKNNILRLQEKACKFEEYELECSDMERFWERVIVKLMKTQI